MTTLAFLDEAVCKLDEEATAALDPVIAGAFYGARCEWSDMLLGQCACKHCRPDLSDVDYGQGVDMTGVWESNGGVRTHHGQAPVAGTDEDDPQFMSIPVTKVA